MYAILKHGGHQYRVSAGDRLLVDRIPADVGSTITLEPVLLVADGASVDAGEQSLGDARVTATVVAHRRGRKLRVFTYKPKKRRRRTLGYRSQLTELVVEEVIAHKAAPARATRSRQRAEAAPEPAAGATPDVPAATAEEPAPASARPRRAAAPRKKVSDGA
ncbi:MAG: 50S ribosomal protein L21 [Candidatus Dormibacteraeota bacterium]|nr:50S ribosomal protein L21 [Candidatus Dormibacteraeota bacterium]MBV9524916.1 50S ribosomal protein L21 [Candidatus Dormibacteraeota bacterium]